MEVFSEKEKILLAASKLFSDNEYDQVSMRDIAEAAGIKTISVHGYFSSKGDILKSLYEFYAQKLESAAPTLKDLLVLAETKPIESIAAELDSRFPPQVREMMDRIYIIICRRISMNSDSKLFILRYLIEVTMAIVIPPLARMIELGKIEPADASWFALLLTYKTFSAAVSNTIKMKIDTEQWFCVRDMLLSLMKTKED